MQWQGTAAQRRANCSYLVEAKSYTINQHLTTMLIDKLKAFCQAAYPYLLRCNLVWKRTRKSLQASFHPWSAFSSFFVLQALAAPCKSTASIVRGC